MQKKGNLQIQVAFLLETCRVQVQEDDKVEEPSVQAEVEAAVEAFKLVDHQASYESYESEDEY